MKQNPQGVSCEDTDSARTYILVEESVHRRAMLALKKQQDLEAIRRGVAQLDASSGTPVADVRQQLARELGFSAKGS